MQAAIQVTDNFVDVGQRHDHCHWSPVDLRDLHEIVIDEQGQQLPDVGKFGLREWYKSPVS